MTFVGTRPEVRKYVDAYTEEMMATLLMPAGSHIPRQHKLIRTRMSSWTHIRSKGMTVDDAYVDEVLPDKMGYNLEYIEEFGFLYDIKLMLKTAVSVIR